MSLLLLSIVRVGSWTFEINNHVSNHLGAFGWFYPYITPRLKEGAASSHVFAVEPHQARAARSHVALVVPKCQRRVSVFKYVS